MSEPLTVEQLQGYPEGQVVYDHERDKWTRSGDGWWEFPGLPHRNSRSLIGGYGPIYDEDPTAGIAASTPGEPDLINAPPHYRFDNGVEVIDLTEQLSFNAGNAVKYLARAGRKTENPIQDLQKARYYVEREIARLQFQGKLSTST